MVISLLPVIIGTIIFIFGSEVMHTPAFRWHEGVLILILSILVEFPYAKYLARPLAGRLMLPSEAG